MEAADDYRESLCHCLNSCLDSVNVAMNRNRNIKFAGTTMITSIKHVVITCVLISYAIMYILQALPPMPVIDTLCFIFGFSSLKSIVTIDCSKWLLYIIAFVATINDITVGTLFGVWLGFINFLLQAQSTLSNRQVMTFPIFMSFITGIMLFSAIWYHSNQSSKITGILSFLMVLFYCELLSMTFLLAGMFWSIMYAISGRYMKFHHFAFFMSCLAGFTIQAVSGIGRRLFGADAGHLMQSIGVGIGGGIVALCTLIFVSSINIPLFDDSMTEFMECYNENIQDLELIKKRHQRCFT